MRILITGARRGIGAALALGLAEEELVLHHLGAARECEAIAAGCRNAEVVEADLADPAQVRALAAAAGPVDVIVNNAAFASYTTWDAVPLEEWNTALAVNVTAPMLLAQALAPGMRDRGWGRIVNITSATVRMGGPSGPAYVAAKAALTGLTGSLARSLGPHGITVNAVSPGAVRTESETEGLAGRTQEQLDADVLARQAVQRRLGPDDLVGCVRFLISDGAAAVTGQVIEVGGGLIAL
ncbi:3-oxoacyl-[acyl-carrier protein] reductase [Catenulispora sp. EB89]|uniref:SDR family NAD(P)-dependent oxidoreductase n=1 Tax=Catenulispora sp. EB89 TaxID=3156257 RepID=UPI003513E058